MTKRRRVPVLTPAAAAGAAVEPLRAWHTAAIVAALVAGTCLVYAPVRHFDFVEVDDPLYVTENPHLAGGLTSDNVGWALSNRHAGYWIPLTWISYMADVEMYGGINAGGHHTTNLVLHVANTLLLFGLLRRTTGATVRSAFVAALFAVHPLHVESVAWITERKDVLSTLFWLLGIWAYAKYVDRPGPWRYTAIAAAMVCGLLAKPMLVTFPLVLLLMDVWPLGRIPSGGVVSWRAWKPLLLEKAPLAVFVAVAGVVTYIAQAQAGAAPTFEALPLGVRVENALVSYAVYLWKTVWPTSLTMLYPFPASIPAAAAAGSAALLAGITVGVLRTARHRPYLAVGWFWYLATLFPVIGIVQVGTQARADRFMYVPAIGLFVMVTWLIAELASSTRRRAVLAAVGVVLVAGSGVRARQQLAYWQDNVTLWTHALETTLGVSSYEAHVSLGRTLAAKARLGEALAHFEAALAAKPSAIDVERDLARVLVDLGRPDDAVTHLRHIVQVRPDIAAAHLELAVLLANQGQAGAAIAEYQQARTLEPGIEGVDNNIGVLLAQQGRYAEAVAHFEAAVLRGPDVETARVNLGLALANLGRLQEARTHFLEALRRNPENAAARRAIEEWAGR
jgi:protein O-mannosyl-transferase